MNTRKLLQLAGKPALYEPGNALMWTDPHISRQLLEVHLNPDMDLASRKYATIKKTAGWILSQVQGESLRILDLGCGPGLYAELFAQKGHEVTGVDFSENSIRHARQSAAGKQLDIRYRNESYLEMELPEDHFDLVLLIFADLGPLTPSDRENLLGRIKKTLKPGGIFIFDVLNDSDIESKVTPKSWEVSDRGFWKDAPYLALSESYLYEAEKVVLYQHIILSGQDDIRVYRFWNHFFSDEDLNAILSAQGFNGLKYFRNIIPDGQGYLASDVTFCRAVNP